MVYTEPLNLQFLLQNTLAGSPEIFIGLFIIGLSILAGIFRMPKIVYALLLVLASIILYGWLGGGLYYFVIIIGALLIFWGITKIIKR